MQPGQRVLIAFGELGEGPLFLAVVTVELDGAFAAWLPIRRGQVHRTHGQVIAVRAEADRAALGSLPAVPYLVADKHLRRVGKDCLILFEASLYSVPARKVRPGQRVSVQSIPTAPAPPSGAERRW